MFEKAPSIPFKTKKSGNGSYVSKLEPINNLFQFLFHIFSVLLMIFQTFLYPTFKNQTKIEVSLNFSIKYING